MIFQKHVRVFSQEDRGDPGYLKKKPAGRLVTLPAFSLSLPEIPYRMKSGDRYIYRITVVTDTL